MSESSQFVVDSVENVSQLVQHSRMRIGFLHVVAAGRDSQSVRWVNHVGQRLAELSWNPVNSSSDHPLVVLTFFFSA